MKQIKKIFALGLTWALCAVLLAGCSAGNGGGGSTSDAAAVKTTVRVGALKGPTGLGMAELMERAERKEAGNDYEFTIAGAPDELNGKIISGQLDIAAIPTNLAAVLYQKTEGKVKIISSATLGVLYLLQKPDGETPAVTEMGDLADKTIYSTGQGATQEYVLNYLLERNGVTNAMVEYRSEHAELATLLLGGKAPLALLPQPFVTTVLSKDDTVRVALDINEEWEAVAGGAQLMMGGIVVRTEFLEQNKEAADRFLEEYAASVSFVNGNVEEAAALSGKFDIVPEEVAQKAIPQCNIVCITGSGMKQSVEMYLDVLFGADPKSVGGKLPDDAFYYLP